MYHNMSDGNECSEESIGDGAGVANLQRVVWIGSECSVMGEPGLWHLTALSSDSGSSPY